jgi:hypothetical protein
MMRVRVAVELARDLDPRTRDLCLKLVDFCSGAREDVPAIYNPRDRQPRLAGRRGVDKIQSVDSDPVNTNMSVDRNALPETEIQQPEVEEASPAEDLEPDDTQQVEDPETEEPTRENY